jgi:hypothetical protein
VIREEAAHIDNAMLLDNLTSEAALEEAEIGNTDPNIPIDNNCTYDELHFGMAGGSGDFEDEGDRSDTIPTASRRGRSATFPERFEQGTCDVDRYEGEDGDDADADREEEASQADEGSTQNVED